MSRKKKKKIIQQNTLEQTNSMPVNDGYGVVELNLDEVGVDNYGNGSISEYEKTVREIENYKEPGKFKRFLKSFLPWRGDGAKEIIRKLVFIIALAVFIFSAIYIINYQVEKIKNDKIVSEVLNNVDQVDKDIDDKVNEILDKELEERIQEKIKELSAEVETLKAEFPKIVQKHGFENVKEFQARKEEAREARNNYYRELNAWEDMHVPMQLPEDLKYMLRRREQKRSNQKKIGVNLRIGKEAKVLNKSER